MTKRMAFGTPTKGSPVVANLFDVSPMVAGVVAPPVAAKFSFEAFSYFETTRKFVCGK